MGFEVYAGFEYEYFVFDETPDSVRAKHYRDLKPMAPGYFGYSVIRNTVHSDFYLETLDLCEKMRFPLEALHEETGPGVLEAAIAVDEGLAAGFLGTHRTADLQAELGLPTDMHPVGVITVGHPLPDRRSGSLKRGWVPPDVFVHWERW